MFNMFIEDNLANLRATCRLFPKGTTVCIKFAYRWANRSDDSYKIKV